MKNPQIFNNEQSLHSLLTIFRTLCLSKPSRADALDLLFHILLLLPLQSYQQHLPTIIEILKSITVVDLIYDDSQLERSLSCSQREDIACDCSTASTTRQ